jgi:protein TonB
MPISKFDLCKPEWLELVFAKRNKEYGAYYLRQHYAENMVKAMGITFVSIAGAALLTGVLIGVKPTVKTVLHETVVELKNLQPPVPPKEEIKKPETAKPTPPVKTTKYVPMVVTDKPVTEEPPTLTELKGSEVGPVSIKDPGNGPAVIVIDKGGTGIGTGETTVAKPDESIHFGADVMPEPYGGAAGWNKFLQKNLRYPPEAIDKNISGKVFVSFVVEKDGQLSNIKVDRGAGFGMDEEAARVLKLSKAWKPGMQNGQPVRVRYTLPISFSISQ